jgi:hypothetical protein
MRRFVGRWSVCVGEGGGRRYWLGEVILERCDVFQAYLRLYVSFGSVFMSCS